MNKKRNTPILLASCLLCLTTWCATNVFGAPSLTAIPTLADDGASPFNEGRAVTRDGEWVVGVDGPGPIPAYPTRGFLYKVSTGFLTNVLSSDGAQSIVACGIGYRTSGANTELIIRGTSSGYGTEWMTADGGTTFAPKRRNTSFTYNNIGALNQLGAAAGSDAYYVMSQNASPGTSLLYVQQGSGPWVATITYDNKGIASDVGYMNGVSASGRAVGWRGATKTQADRRNYMLTYNGSGTPTPVFFNGLAGTDKGEAYAVSADGSVVFGRSALVTGGTDYYAYKVVNPGASQTIGALPLFGDETGSVTVQVPYWCTADGRYAVGMAYRGQERAVVWNTIGSDPTKWTVLDLTDLARNNGFLGDFTLNLRRAYSTGTNGAGDLVVTGYGVNSAVAVRAFVMTVPEWIAQIGFPGNQTVNAGANVTIAVKTNGTDSLSFQWYKNGSELSGATSTSLTYSGVSCLGGEAGTYSVFVTNNAISEVVKGQMALTVLDPYFTLQPSPSIQTNAEGGSVTYTIAAAGSPTISYKWQRNRVDLTDGTTAWGSVIAGSSTTALTISNLKAEDGTNSPGSGVYTAVLTTSAGGCSTTSQAVRLNVLGRPVLQNISWTVFGWPKLSFNGPANKDCTVFYSTDIALPLASWTPIATNQLSGGVDSWEDIEATGVPRFYLLRIDY